MSGQIDEFFSRAEQWRDKMSALRSIALARGQSGSLKSTASRLRFER